MDNNNKSNCNNVASELLILKIEFIGLEHLTSSVTISVYKTDVNLLQNHVKR